MNIVLISQDFLPLSGGISSYLFGLYVKYFSDDNFIAIIPAYIEEDISEKNLKFKIIRTHFKPFDINENRTSETNYMLKVLINIKPDLILFGYLRSHPEVGIIYKSLNPTCKIGLITHAKEVYFNEVIQNNYEGSHIGYTSKEIDFYTEIIEDFDIIFSVSEFTKSLLLEQGIVNRIEILNPIITNESNAVFLNKNKNHLNILSVGRLIKRKGHLEVIQVIRQLIDDGYKVKYNIIGYGPEESILLKSIEDLGLKSTVSIYTDIIDSKLQEFYRESDIFILNTKFIQPNDIEGLGIVFLEANSFGLPTIGGNSGGVKDAIIHNKSGVLIEPDSLDEIYNALETLILNPMLRMKMGEYGKARILKEFNPTKTNIFEKFCF